MSKVTEQSFPEKKIFTSIGPGTQSKPVATVISLEKITKERTDFLAESMRKLVRGLTAGDFDKALLDPRTPDRYYTEQKAKERIAALAVSASARRPNAPYLLFAAQNGEIDEYDPSDVIGFLNFATEQISTRERIKQRLTGETRLFTGWLKTHSLARRGLDPVRISTDAFWTAMSIAERTDLAAVHVAVAKEAPVSEEITVIEHAVRMPSGGFQHIKDTQVRIEDLDYDVALFKGVLKNT